jgi:hypothetical protein
VEFEGHEEKYRAVIEGATPKMNWSAKGGTGRACNREAKALLIHPPHQGACGRHGTEEQCVTSGGLAESPGGTRSKRTYKRERNGERSSVSSRTASWYLKHSQKLFHRGIGGGSGPETGAGEGGWEVRGNQTSKGGEEDQFHE